MASDNESGKRRIIGRRRRQPTSGGRGRADTTRRWGTTSSGSTTTGSSSSGGGLLGGLGALGGLLSGLGSSSSSSSSGGLGSSSSGRKGCLSGSKGCLIIGIIIVVIALVVVAVLLLDCGNWDLFDKGPNIEQTTIQTSTSFTQSSTKTTSSTTYTPSGGNQKWLVMLFQDADDSVLEKDIYIDLNEAEIAGSSSEVMIVAQIDRYSGSYSGDGNWTGTKRFVINQDDNLDQLNSQEVANLGELNMSSGQTLIDFVTWAIQTYPADRYALILSDHGMGWPGGWTDSSPTGSGDPNIPLAAAIGDMLYLNELDDALGKIRAQTDIDKLDVIGLDACLMAQLEVFSALAPHARYAIASEETEPALGWAYAGFLQALNQNPDMSGAELSNVIVESYIDDDQLISSNRERQEMSKDITLTAVDLSNITLLNNSLNKLAFIFQEANQQVLASSSTYAQSFTSVFGSDVPPSYIDIGNLLQIIKQKNSNSDINDAINEVLTAIDQAVVTEKHGVQKAGSTGISIYFPNSGLYKSSITGAESYTAIADRFATESLWDDFLAYHYTGRQFEASDAQAVVPSSSSVSSPAAGGITVSSLTASSTQIDWSDFVTLSADISGENIGYIYLFVGYYDEQANSIFIADQDYIESPDTRFADGVYYPDWGQGDFTLEFDWEPIVFAINDGTNTITALFKPESYGGSSAEAVYTVDGIYTYADDNEQCYARLYFSDGTLRKVIGFTGSNDASTPHEITPEAGDQFTVTETWIDLDSSGNVVTTATQQGGTLTFGNQLFTWETLYAAAGSYKVGFVIEDLDGNEQQSLIEITVT